MAIEDLHRLIAHTARQLEETAAELRAALDGSAGCGCDTITVCRDPTSDSLSVRCNRGRETKINTQYAQLMLINNSDVIQHIALMTAEDHGLEVEAVAQALHKAVTSRDGAATIKVR